MVLLYAPSATFHCLECFCTSRNFVGAKLRLDSNLAKCVCVATLARCWSEETDP